MAGSAAMVREHGGMQILGLVFAGTSTRHRTEMAAFLNTTLSLPRQRVDGVEAEGVSG